MTKTSVPETSLKKRTIRTLCRTKLLQNYNQRYQYLKTKRPKCGSGIAKKSRSERAKRITCRSEELFFWSLHFLDHFQKPGPRNQWNYPINGERK